MRRWLEARQAGVTHAREALRGAASGKVFFSAEVNLVQASRTTGAPNMINRVIPFIQLDMVSYSSYDSQMSSVDFPACLDFIAANHNRTDASPPGNASYFVAEYGVAEHLAPNATVASERRAAEMPGFPRPLLPLTPLMRCPQPPWRTSSTPRWPGGSHTLCSGRHTITSAPVGLAARPTGAAIRSTR